MQVKSILLSTSATILALCSSPGIAHGLTQPDGTPIPVGNGLQSLFDTRGEAINALATAGTTPTTFRLGCALSCVVLQRNAGYQNSFGWYNVTGVQPGLADLHELLGCTDGVGTQRTVNIRNDPNYAGGEIGFYQGVDNCASGSSFQYAFFSQPAYNPDGAQANPNIHLLVYASTVAPDAYYLGWEDLISGGDDDFDDLTVYVQGAGECRGVLACPAPGVGVCAHGLAGCVAGGGDCVGATPSGEVCDGLDNDCNGDVDDGAPCGSGTVCTDGACVARCVTGSCGPGETCDASTGHCVEQACAAMVCGPGERCRGGVCGNPCQGVVCPYGQDCAAGHCVDPCSVVTCGVDDVCVAGLCAPRCDCVACPAGNSCDATGRCIPDPCLGNACAPDAWCQADGSCVSRCLGAVCPSGQTCELGACVTVNPSSSSSSGGTSGSAANSGSAGSSSDSAVTSVGSSVGASSSSAATSTNPSSSSAAGTSQAVSASASAGSSSRSAAMTSSSLVPSSRSSGTTSASGASAGASSGGGTAGGGSSQAPDGNGTSAGRCTCAKQGARPVELGVVLLVAAFAARKRRR